MITMIGVTNGGGNVDIYNDGNDSISSGVSRDTNSGISISTGSGDELMYVLVVLLILM